MNIYLRELEKLFKVVANKRRLELLNFLLDKKRASLRELSETLEMPFKTASRNLIILERAGFVQSKTERGQVLYNLQRDFIHRWNLVLLSLLKDAQRKSSSKRTKAEVADDMIRAAFEPTLGNLMRAFNIPPPT